MSALDDLDWRAVHRHYQERVQIHSDLLNLRGKNDVRSFTRLLLGVTNRAGNYSADERNLGPKILSENSNAERRVFDLAGKFIPLEAARDVPRLIKEADLRYLKIGVGSEASCMVNPKICWVANTRTIWTHLVIKHADDFRKANEELKLYRDADTTSEMAYQIWTAIHRELAVSMVRIAEEGERLARGQGIRRDQISVGGCNRERTL